MNETAITGSTGFVGRQLCAWLGNKGLAFRPVLRGAQTGARPDAGASVGDILATEDWRRAFVGASAVVHLMAIAHSYGRTVDEIDAVNVHAAVAAAQGAREAGVKRFVFVSSTQVFGLDSSNDIVGDNHPLKPTTPYAAAKCRAEEAILKLSPSFEQGVVILRPPLVYGPQPKGNVLTLVKLVRSGVPLPFGSFTSARRTMVSTHNFAEALHRAASMPMPPGPYIVTDSEALTLRQVLEAIAQGLEKPLRVFPFPPPLIRGFRFLPKIGALVDKLTGPLVYDGRRFNEVAHWTPSLPPVEGMKQAAESVAKMKPNAI